MLSVLDLIFHQKPFCLHILVNGAGSGRKWVKHYSSNLSFDSLVNQIPNSSKVLPLEWLNTLTYTMSSPINIKQRTSILPQNDYFQKIRKNLQFWHDLTLQKPMWIFVEFKRICFLTDFNESKLKKFENVLSFELIDLNWLMNL